MLIGHVDLIHFDKVRAVLIRARMLLARGWCQNNYATKQGRNIEWRSDEAEAYCLTGAIWRACADLGLPLSYGRCAVERLSAVTGRRNVVRYNDDPRRKLATILRACDRAVGGK